jgi:hypothetical protein
MQTAIGRLKLLAGGGHCAIRRGADVLDGSSHKQLGSEFRIEQYGSRINETVTCCIGRQPLGELRAGSGTGPHDRRSQAKRSRR